MEFDRFNNSDVTFINIVRGIDRWLCVIWLTSHRNRNTQFFMEFIIISLFSDTPLWAKMRSSFHIMTSSHFALQWRHNERDGVSIHVCLPNRLFRTHERNHQSSASLAFVRGIHRSLVNSPHKGPVTRKMLPFDDVIMVIPYSGCPSPATSRQGEGPVSGNIPETAGPPH